MVIKFFVFTLILFFLSITVGAQEKDSLFNIAKIDSNNIPALSPRSDSSKKAVSFVAELGAGFLFGGVFAATGYLIGVSNMDNFSLDELNQTVALTYGGYIFGTFLGTYWVAHKYNKRVEWEFTLLYGIAGGLASYAIAKNTEGHAGFLAVMLPLAGELIYINAIAPKPVYYPENATTSISRAKIYRFADLYNIDRLNVNLLKFNF